MIPEANVSREIYKRYSSVNTQEKNMRYKPNQVERKKINIRKKNPEVFFVCFHTSHHPKKDTHIDMI
jgi:hypothetical protein